MKKAIWLKTNGEKIKVTPKNGKAFSLEELQGFVGGCLDIVRLKHGLQMYVNDNGVTDGLPKNKEASRLFQEAYPIKEFPLNNLQTIVGNAVLFGRGIK